MNRCSPRPRPMQAVFGPLLVTALLCAVAPAWAQQQMVRPFPATAKRGAMQVTQPPELLMDGAPERLSPGARIRGPNNMLVMSGSLVGKTLLVNYVREPHGMVHEVWILNAAELAAPSAKP